MSRDRGAPALAVRLVLVLVRVLVLASCSAGSAEPAPDPTTTPTPASTSTTTIAVSPEGLSATLERYREDDSTGVIQIQVANRSDAVVVLDQVQLRWAGFTERPARSGPVQLWAGQVLDIPVPGGTAVCPPWAGFDVVLPGGPVEVAALAAFDGAAPVRVVIPVSDVRGVLRRLYVPACQEQALAATATVSFGPVWTDTAIDGRPAATGVLRLHRTGRSGPAVRVVEVLGTVLLRVDPIEAPAQGEPWLTLGSTDGGAELPVALLQSGDCRPHALAESKHTFFLRAAVAVEGGPTLTVYVRPDADDEGQLLRLINRACGVG